MRARKISRSETPPNRVVFKLAGYFQRNGYVRHQDGERLRAEGYMGYKKGDELRLFARNAEELAEIRRLLGSAGFRSGRPFMKHRQYCQPVYGRTAVRRFLGLVQAKGNAGPLSSPRGQ